MNKFEVGQTVADMLVGSTVKIIDVKQDVFGPVYKVEHPNGDTELIDESDLSPFIMGQKVRIAKTMPVEFPDMDEGKVGILREMAYGSDFPFEVAFAFDEDENVHDGARRRWFAEAELEAVA
jgi:hypothetical protein